MCLMGDYKMVSQFLKGIYDKDPPKPKYCSVWVSNHVLELRKHQAENKELNHKYLNQKLCILLMLPNVQMKHHLLTIQIYNVIIKRDKIIFYLTRHSHRIGQEYVYNQSFFHMFYLEPKTCIVKVWSSI